MANVQADWQTLQTIGTKLETEYGGDAGSFLALINEIDGHLNTAQEGWVGSSSEHYAEQWMQELMPQFKQAAEIIAILGKNINNYGKDLEEIERNHSK